MADGVANNVVDDVVDGVKDDARTFLRTLLEDSKTSAVKLLLLLRRRGRSNQQRDTRARRIEHVRLGLSPTLCLQRGEKGEHAVWGRRIACLRHLPSPLAAGRHLLPRLAAADSTGRGITRAWWPARGQHA